MTDYGWSITTPGNSVTIGSLPGHITDTRDMLSTRLNLEHTTIATGTGVDDVGCLHKKGSARAYYASSAPSVRPDGATSLDANDDGRLAIDSDNGTLTYWDGSAWQTASMSGGVGGGDVALLAGRSGGQTILGGTGSGDALNLGGSSHADEGPINIVAADTTLVECNSVPFWSLVLGEAMNANSQKITGLANAASAGDALALGAAVITASELSTTGGVPRIAWGTNIGVTGTNQTKDVGFTPDLVLVFSASTGAMAIWTADMTSGYNKLSSGAYGNTFVGVTVAGTTLTFPADQIVGNYNAKRFWYVAFKLNEQQDPA